MIFWSILEGKNGFELCSALQTTRHTITSYHDSRKLTIQARRTKEAYGFVFDLGVYSVFCK